MITTSIETLLAVARHAAKDPQPLTSGAANCAPSMTDLLPRLATLVAGLLGADAQLGATLRIIAKAVATFVPPLNFDPPPASPPARAGSRAKTRARIDLLHQERDARASERRIGETLIAKNRVRPARPPAVIGFAPAAPQAPPADAWNDLLDLTSEVLETFVVLGDAAGAARCVELLDLLANTFAVDSPAAA